MTFSPLDPEVLGTIIQDACAAGASAETLGGFIFLQVGRHPLLSANEFGVVLSNLLKVSQHPSLVGQFAIRQLGRLPHQLATGISYADPVSMVDHIGEGVAIGPDVKQLVVQSLTELGIRTKKPNSTKIPIKLVVDGRTTSVGIDKALIDDFVQALGKESLRKAIKAAGQLVVSPGQTRSFLVQKHLRAELSAFLLKSGMNVLQFPTA